MPADDLGSELGTVFVDDLDGHFEGRSGSAAERAGARFSGSLARRSPWFSCSGSLVRFASVVLGPGSMPLSVSACSTRARSGSTPAAGLVGPPAGPSRASCRAPCAVVPVGQPVPSPRAGTAAVSASPTCSCLP